MIDSGGHLLTKSFNSALFEMQYLGDAHLAKIPGKNLDT